MSPSEKARNFVMNLDAVLFVVGFAAEVEAKKDGGNEG